MSGPLTCESLREALSYDPVTGRFTWLVSPSNRVNVGDVAGSENGDGYIQIGFLGRTHQAHRLAWLHVHGAFPVAEIDHIDGCRTNNRIANLRDVTSSVNHQNQRRAMSSSSHGFLGISRSGTRWRALIWVDGKQRYLGTYDAPDIASAAYVNAKRQSHEGNML